MSTNKLTIIGMFRYLVCRRLAKISAHFNRVAEQPTEYNLTPIQAPGADEIGVAIAVTSAVDADFQPYPRPVRTRFLLELDSVTTPAGPACCTGTVAPVFSSSLPNQFQGTHFLISISITHLVMSLVNEKSIHLQLP